MIRGRMPVRPWNASIVVLALVGLYAGWRSLWFLTDDAFIAFRYVSNSILGFGYVWNPLPFRPVEGYTSFLWVAILDLIWRVLGIEPPRAANVILLGFSSLTVLLTAWMMLRLRLRAALVPFRPLLLLLVLAGTVGNRTFLAFASSGLETALVNFLLTAWVALALVVGKQRAWRLPLLALTAALSALARPDGLLFTAATGVLVAIEAASAREARGSWRRSMLAVAPLLLVPAHLIWRRGFYGAWLPNTYHAKFVAPWPESGIRYLLSFVLEYALWLWVGLAVWFLARHLHRAFAPAARANRSVVAGACAPIVVIAALVAHAGYYVFIVGGDHFEYRVLSQLIPLFFLSAAWLLDATNLSRGWVVAGLTIFVLASLPVPWVHYGLSQKRQTRAETWKMRVAVTEAFPGFLHGYTRLFDSTQAWLIDKGVCARHREHLVCWRTQVESWPTRARGFQLPADEYPVIALQTLGVAGWVLPRINIIDRFGLNDWVIARSRPKRDGNRIMAHEREPPPGYVDCFRPNVLFGARPPTVVSRILPVTAQQICECERKAWVTNAP